MTVVVKGLALLAFFASVPAFAQERQHEQHQAQTEAASAKPATTKCCEGMDKVVETKGVMPMKGEMTDEMKAKMEKMKEMKEKMAKKMGEKGMKMQTNAGKDEQSPSTKDAHQQ